MPAFAKPAKKLPGEIRQVKEGRRAGRGRAAGLLRRMPTLPVSLEDVRQDGDRCVICVSGRGPENGSGVCCVDDA